MHGLWYLWLIGDEDSSVYHSVVTGVPLYGRDITRLSVPTTQSSATETGWKHCVMISLVTVVNMGYLKP